MTAGSLFSGIGGFDRGFSLAGIKPQWACEIEPSCRRILRRHWPDIPLFEDVRECGAHNLSPVDVISFGSPCQDLSIAGKRAGLDGQRSGLFYEAIRICGELCPAFAVWENVPGALSSNDGRDFAAVLAAFRECGASDIAWRILDSRYFGVAQRRRRVFVVADFRGERAGEILFESQSLRGDLKASGEARQVAPTLSSSGAGTGRTGNERTEADFLIPITARQQGSGGNLRHREDQDTLIAAPFCIKGAAIGRQPHNGPQHGEIIEDGTSFTLNCTEVHAVAAPLTARCGKGGFTDPVNDNILPIGVGGSEHSVMGVSENQRSEVRLTPYSRQMTSGGGKPGQGYPAALIGMSVRRLTPVECERLQGFPDGWTAGESDSARYRALGNAVTVPVAQWIGRRIMEAAS